MPAHPSGRRTAIRALAASAACLALVAAGPGTAQARSAPVRKAPPTLGALAKKLDAAIVAKGSVRFVHSTVVAGSATNTAIGTAKWVKGFASLAVAETSGSTRLRLISLPSADYSFDPTGAGRWIRFREGGRGPKAISFTGDLQLLRQRVNPGRLLPGLSGLEVKQSVAKVVAHVKCSVYTVTMTGTQLFATQPAVTRPAPDALVGSTAVVTFYLDSRGLPVEVTEVIRGSFGAYAEITTFTRWGAAATVARPTGKIIDDPVA